MRRVLPSLLLLACFVCAEPVAAPAPVYQTTQPSSDGTGKTYMGREIAHVMGHQAADWLERAERDQEEKPDLLVENMTLRPAEVVADIGAGTGYFSFRMSKKVPQGKVLAVDIQQEMLDLLSEKSKQLGVTNVEPVLGTESDPKLPEAAVDCVLMVDAYHEFSQPREMMEGIFKSLKPGGRVVLVEYRGEDPKVPIKPHHKMTEAQAIKEMRAVGLEHRETLKVLPWQHLMVFIKPEKPQKP
jgi:ubiquinone/menaquinone biosynthesis C-methylase UbiE